MTEGLDSSAHSVVSQEPSAAVRFLLRYGIAVVMAVFYVMVALHFDYTPDDTYIYLQYARSLAEGDGFSFNDGTPRYGITGPLWALVIAGGTKMGLDPSVAAKSLDLVLASFSILVLYLLSFVMIRDKVSALIAAWMFTFDATFLKTSATGLESSLAIVLSLLAVWYAYRKEYALASFVVGVLTLVRPEGALMMLAIAVDVFWQVAPVRRCMFLLLRSFLVFAAVVGAWLMYALLQFGSVIPHVLGSAAMVEAGERSGISATVSSLTVLGATQGASLVFLLVGIVLMVRLRGWAVLKEDGFPLIWVFSVLILSMLMNVSTESQRYLIIIPFIILFAVWSLKKLEILSLVTPRRATGLLLLLVGFSLAQNQLTYHTHVVPEISRYTNEVNEGLRPIAQWLSTQTDEKAGVASPEIGLIRYVGARRTFQTVEVRRNKLDSLLESLPHDASLPKERSWWNGVDYVVDRSSLPDRLASASLVPVMTRPLPAEQHRETEAHYYTLYKVVRP